MDPEAGSGETGQQNDAREERPDVTREVLYQLVWADPMLKVAARFRVSSSYMARICTLMNVPRPERGYWAKLAVGKSSNKPSLQAIRPGDQAIWNRSGEVQAARRPLPQAPTAPPKRKRKATSTLPEVHPLIVGAKEHFEVGRTSYWSKYLRPAKRNLVDLVVSKGGLEKALVFANCLFREFEAHECRVVLAPNGEPVSRAAIDEHEIPKKQIHDSYEHSGHWSPGRITVVYIGSLVIGLTIFEMSEEADGRYVDGNYVRVDHLPSPKRARYADDWRTSKHDFPSGRLCLQAYCADRRAQWTKQWRETVGHALMSKVPTIVRDLIDATPHIAELIAAGERQAELERIRWEEQKRKWERERAEEAVRKARKESREDLFDIIKTWNEAKQIEAFFADAELRLRELDPDRLQLIASRLTQARKLIGSIDALARFQDWKTPEER
jgi:hypothetical protein